jgi:hypothetical protein
MWYPPDAHPSRVDADAAAAGAAQVAAPPAPPVEPPPQAGPIRRVPGAGEPLPPFRRGGIPLPVTDLVGDGTGGDDRPPEPMSEELRMAKVEAAMAQMPTAPQGSVWGTYDHYRSLSEMQATRTVGKSSLLGRAGRDHRGLFAAVTGLILVVLTFFPWFVWTVGQTSREFSVWSTQYSGWYVAIPMVTVLAILVGLLNFFLRPGDPGALAVFILLRILAIGTVALIAVAMYYRTPSGAPKGLLTPAVSLKWPIVAALAMGVIMVAISLSSGLRKGPD